MTATNSDDSETCDVHDFQERSSATEHPIYNIDLGNYLVSQRLIFVFGFILTAVSAWHNLMLTFLAPSVDHWCSRQGLNVTVAQWRNSNLPLETRHGKSSYSQCRFWPPGANRSNQSEECSQWEFDTSSYKSTIVSEWMLVCNYEWLISLSQSIFMAGFVTAMLFFSQLSDRFGRKPIILAAILVFLLSGFGCLAANSYTTFTIMRFFVSLGISGAGSTIFILLMEIAEPSSRSHYGVGYQFGWAFGFTVLPGIAWFVRDWFYLELVTMIPAITFIGFWWFIPESPRWLLSSGSYEKLLSVIHEKCHTQSKDELSQSLAEVKERLLEQEKNGFKRATFLDLLRMPNMRKKTVNIFFCWFVNSFIYYGLSLNTSDLGGNIFLNFFISGFLEFPAYVVSILAIRLFGRRIPQMATMVIGGAACLFTIPLTNETLWPRIILAMTGKFCITASFAILQVFSAEMYPTVVRNAGMGFSSVFARIGSMLAPFIKELGHATHTSVPFAVFGSLSILSGLLVLLLPETQKISLPNTVAEGEEIRRSTSSCLRRHRASFTS